VTTQPEPAEYPDLDEYREACWQHSDSHYDAATDPELCDDDDCPHWPSWWVNYASVLSPAD